MININLYGIFIIALSICIVLFRIPVTNDFIKSLLLSENLTSVFQSTITCISIMIGFLGTLISQIISMKNKEKNSINLFFSLAKNNTVAFTILTCIISGVIVIVLSLLLLTSDVMDDFVKELTVYLWIYSFIVFLYYDLSVYHVFISLLFFQNDNNPLHCSDTNEDIVQCMDSLEETNKH